MAIGEARRRRRHTREPVDFGALHTRYFDDVSGFIARRLGDADLAEDLAQEAFARAFRSRENFDSTKPVWPWLSRIAHNLLINARRDEGRRRARFGEIEQQLTPASSVEDPETTYAGRQLRHAIDGALAELSPRARRILLMRCSEGCTYAEIAAAEGMTNDAVKASLKRARKTFRTAYDRLSDEPTTWALGPLLRRLTVQIRTGAMSLLQDSSFSTLTQVVASTVVAAAISGALVMGPTAPVTRHRPTANHGVVRIEAVYSAAHRYVTTSRQSDHTPSEAVIASITNDRHNSGKRVVRLRTVDAPRKGGRRRTNTGAEIPCSPTSVVCNLVDTALER